MAAAVAVTSQLPPMTGCLGGYSEPNAQRTAGHKPCDPLLAICATRSSWTRALLPYRRARRWIVGGVGAEETPRILWGAPWGTSACWGIGRSCRLLALGLFVRPGDDCIELGEEAA